jgi:signal peptidase II
MKFLPLWSTTIIVLILDQTTKSLWGTDTYISLIGNTVAIASMHNRGIAFSIPLQGLLLIIITLAIIIGGVLWLPRRINMNLITTQLIGGMILGGALGNLYDRAFLGSVRDFFKVSIFPVFNIADSFIFIGGVLFVMLYARIQLKK